MDEKGYLSTMVAGLALDKLGWALAVAVMGYIAVHFLMKLVVRALDRFHLEATLSQFLIASIRLALCFVVLLMACDALGVPISSLIALFSVVGLAVSLAIQNLLTNVASGLVLLVSKPFQVGDFIESGAIMGTVQAISLLHTRITTPANKVVFVPNAQLTGTDITNHTMLPSRRMELSVSTPYSARLEHVKPALLEAVEKTHGVLQDPDPFVGITAITAGRVEYVIRAWASSDDFWTVYFALQEAVKVGLDRAMAEHPVEATDVRVVS